MSRETMQEVVDRYLAMRTNRGKAGSTVRNERSALCRFAKAWDKTRKSPRKLDEGALEDYLYGPGGVAQSGRLAPASFNTQLQYLRGFLTWMYHRGMLNAPYLDQLVPMRTEPKEYLRISMGQVHAMIDTCEDPWEKWVLTLASQTLGRGGELCRLKLGDFNTETGAVAWYRPKTRQTDELPMTELLESGLRVWRLEYQKRATVPPTAGSFAVPRRRATPVPGGRSLREWRYSPDEARKRGCADVVQTHVSRVTGLPVTALKGQGVHIMRRSMARALYERLKADGDGYALDVVQALLGHAEQATTEKYIGLELKRERRNDLLRGSRLLSADKTNVIELGVRNGTASGM